MGSRAGGWKLAAGGWRLVTLGCLLASVFAADPAPRVELSATPAQLAVGETVAVVVTYRWPHGWSVASEPDPSADFRNLFVTAAPPAERSSTGEEERRTWRYTVAAARSGAWLLPRPAFTARRPAGPVEAKAPEVIVQVGSEAAPPRLPAPRPLLIRPPERLAGHRRWWWLAGGGLLAAGAVGWWLLRRRRAATTGPSPWQVFTEALAGAKTAVDGKDAGARISLAVRGYAGAIWGFDGPGLTTREIGAALRRIPAGRIADDESRDLLRILARLDDLRWNAGDAPAESMHDLVTLARTWAEAVQRRLDAEAAARAKARAAAEAKP